MLIRLFSSTFCIRPLQCWVMGVALLVIAGPSWAQEMPLMSPSPAINARAAVLLNPATGEILYAKEPHLRLPPASTTKVLTALVVLERLDLNAWVSVSPQAASAAPSRIGLHAGEAASAQDLLYGLLLKSGNDAAEALAEAAGGSVPDFANLMNARAWRLGARDSHFMNPHGLPNDDHYATAYDLALIFSQAMNHPVFAEMVRTHSAALRVESGQGFYSGGRLIPVRSHNRLLDSYEGARGGKTGFTLKARRCFVGEVDRGGVRLIVAILNSPNSGTLWQDARNLFDYGFARYGLASPPPVRLEPELEPEPIMARHAPVVTPAARVALARPEPLEREGYPVVKAMIVPTKPTFREPELVPEPIMARHTPVVTPAARVALARPEPLERERYAVVKAVAVPSKPVPSRTAVSAAGAYPTRTAVSTKSVPSRVTVATKADSPAKPGSGKVVQPLTKAGKPVTAVLTRKLDSQQTTKIKVAARSEQAAPSKQPQKNIKRRG